METKGTRKSKAGLRGMARFCAIQVLYRNEFEKLSVKQLIDAIEKNREAFISEEISTTDMDKDFFKKLLESASLNVGYLDDMISRKLSNDWKIERLDPVVRCILRLGLTELKFFQEIPANVVFNEYIEISKAFFENRDVAFINGLLSEAFNEIKNHHTTHNNPYTTLL